MHNLYTLYALQRALKYLIAYMDKRQSRCAPLQIQVHLRGSTVLGDGKPHVMSACSHILELSSWEHRRGVT